LGTYLRAYAERRETTLDGDQSSVGEYLHRCDGSYRCSPVGLLH
jgi:hypothetical protein